MIVRFVGLSEKFWLPLSLWLVEDLPVVIVLDLPRTLCFWISPRSAWWDSSPVFWWPMFWWKKAMKLTYNQHQQYILSSYIVWFYSNPSHFCHQICHAVEYYSRQILRQHSSEIKGANWDSPESNTTYTKTKVKYITKESTVCSYI